jgi:hypothetical protein
MLIVCCLFENNKKAFYFASFVLFIAAAMRGEGVDRDYKTYISIYEYLSNGEPYTIEPTFIIFSLISKALINSPILIFIIYALLGLYYKAKYIRSFSPYICLSLLLYYSNFYFVHELTQIRIGVASGIGFYALKFLIEGDRKKFILMIFASSLFHFSMLVLLISLVFDRNKISSKFILNTSFLILFSYVLIFLNINLLNLLQYIPIPVIQEKFNIYEYQTKNSMIEQVNIFSAMQFIHLTVLLVILNNAKKFQNNPPMVLLSKLYSLSPICLVLLSPLPAFAIRLSELYSVADIIVLPIIASYCKQNRTARFFIILLSVFVFLINLYHNNIVKGYYIWM